MDATLEKGGVNYEFKDSEEDLVYEREIARPKCAKKRELLMNAFLQDRIHERYEEMREVCEEKGRCVPYDGKTTSEKEKEHIDFESLECISCIIARFEEEGLPFQLISFRQRLINERYRELNHLYDITYRRTDVSFVEEEFWEPEDTWLLSTVEHWIIREYLNNFLKGREYIHELVKAGVIYPCSYVYSFISGKK